MIYFRALFDRKEISDFTTSVAYLDEDYKSEEKYTVCHKLAFTVFLNLSVMFYFLFRFLVPIQ